MDKLNDYQGWTGRVHSWRDAIKRTYANIKEDNSMNLIELTKATANDQLIGNVKADEDYSHIHRHKTRMEFVRVSAAVMGIEFSYAAETAFVSPTLLQIGVEHKHMTLVWALSPLVGFFLCPILGSMSDRCKLNIGRRRPFIILLSIGIFLGLLLVPNGEDLGYWFGDVDYSLQINKTDLNSNSTISNISPHRTTASRTDVGETLKTSHPWGIFFTILGTVLLDFDADACQSPARAYLLDVCIPEDHAKGLSTFTIMAGLGGFMGYSMGGINWDKTSIGKRLGGHIKAVFTIITFIFVTCVIFTITSFKEIPLWAITETKSKNKWQQNSFEANPEFIVNYGTVSTDEHDDFRKAGTKMFEDVFEIEEKQMSETAIKQSDEEDTEIKNVHDPSMVTNKNECNDKEEIHPLSHYLLSVFYMPYSLRMVCVTNLFCWMAHVCYSLYFTDFVGEAVFSGDPRASDGSTKQILYEQGIRFGCWGMAMYSLSCACYSMIIEKLILRFKAKNVYVGGLLFYSAGMTLMAITRAKVGVIIFSWTAGVMYSTLFTMPYLLIAHYHSSNTFELNSDGSVKLNSEIRGLGTDVAIVSSMVFLAQFLLSMCMGTIVSVSGTTTSVISTAAFLSLCGALTATQIMYLDL